MPSTTTSSGIESELIRDEGWMDVPYRDSRGFLTIGVGHNLDAEGLCEEAILAQLRHDICKVEASLTSHLPWWAEQPDPIRRFLINLTFNIGIGGVMKFTSTLPLIKAGRYAEAADSFAQNKRYYAQVGPRAKRLESLLRSVI